MKKSLTPFLKKIGPPFLVFLAIFLLANTGLAAEINDLGIDKVEGNINLGSNTPIQIIVKIIQIFLGFLALLTVIIIIYGGFLWTTSGGNEEKISRAKKLLKNAVIGILIILSSWGIASYILKTLIGATSGGSSTGTSNGSNSQNLSLGTIGSCSIETVYPAPGTKDVNRNSNVLVTTKEPIQLDTVCLNKNTKNPCACDNTDACNLLNSKNIQIYKTNEGNSCVSDNCVNNVTNVEVSVPSGNKTLILKPLSYLGDSNGNVEYAVRLTNNLKKFGGESLFQTCSSDFLEWTFETNNKLDLVPPQVLSGSLFPPVDNLADVFNIQVGSKTAKAQIAVTGCPKVYTPAKKISITKIGPSVNADFEVEPNYSGVITNFKITFSNGKLQLFSGPNLLGASDVVDNKAVFDGYFTITFSDTPSNGHSWDLVVAPAFAAQTLTVGSNTYIFVNTKSGNRNEILVPAVCSLANMAINIEYALSGDSSVIASSNNGTVVTMFAKETGEAGNSITLSSNGNGLIITGFSGGAEKSESYSISGLKDKPMNSVIQLTFNEPMNPMVLSGTADELKAYVRLVNAKANAKANGEACGTNADCLSYDCQAAICVGNYVSGKFSLSNNYRTLEFISNKECGVNSCGETMYCLPAGSNLALRINAATLKTCSSPADCQSPYSDCVTGVCRDVAKNTNFPLADSLKLDGVVDLSFNSLDGNRDNRADGPVTTVYPYFIEGDGDLNKRDGFQFSFWINNQVNLTPPTISLASPYLEETGVNLASPVAINFNDLMMNNTLRTGSLTMNNGLNSTEHKLINLRSSVNKPLGYWISSENKEQGTPDGEPDFTAVKVLHSDFFESVTYISQIGSGVKNIYQNCFKPSIGPACVNLSEANPSCCFGTGTNSLNSDGSCIN